MTLKKNFTLASVPIRLLGAAGMLFLGFKLPYVALVIMIIGVCLGLLGLVIAWSLRNTFHMRSRIPCVNTNCSYKPLRIARICPKCRTPTFVASTKGVQLATSKAMIETAIAMAWSDGQVGQEEQIYLDAIVEASPLPENRKAALRELVKSGMQITSIAVDQIPPKDIERVLSVAASMIVSDGNLLETEEVLYKRLAEHLRIEQRKAEQILARYRQMAWI